MAYVDIGAVSPGDPVAAAYLNQIRANFQASAPDAFTTKGDLYAASAADAGARLAAGANDATLVTASGEATGLIWQTQPAVRVYNNAAIDPTPGGWRALTFNTERFDTDAMHHPSSNLDRLTVPAGGDGLYLTGGNVTFETSAGTDDVTFGIRIILDSVTVIAQEYLTAYRHQSQDVTLCISTLYSLSAAGYLALQVYTSDNVDVLSNGNFSPEFWAIWQRRA